MTRNKIQPFSDPLPIKYLPDRINVLRSLIELRTKEGDCSGACNIFASHCENVSPKIQGVGFYQSYIPVAHATSSIISITIVAMHRLSARILDFINAFHNTYVTILK